MIGSVSPSFSVSLQLPRVIFALWMMLTTSCTDCWCRRVRGWQAWKKKNSNYRRRDCIHGSRERERNLSYNLPAQHYHVPCLEAPWSAPRRCFTNHRHLYDTYLKISTRRPATELPCPLFCIEFCIWKSCTGWYIASSSRASIIKQTLSFFALFVKPSRSRKSRAKKKSRDC